MRRFVVLMLVSALLSGCASRQGLYSGVDRSRDQADYDRIVERLKRAKESGDFPEKDRLLYSMELGLAEHYAGQYDASNTSLARADEQLDRLYTKSLTNMGGAFLTNSNTLPYRGEPHENVYINNFKALNYLQLNENSAARVEVRKLDEKLSRLEERFEQTAENYRNSLARNLSDTSVLEEHVQFEAGQSGFHTSVFGRYLGYISYLNDHDLDDARIDLNKMREAYLNQPEVYDPPFPDLPRDPVEGEDRTRVYAVGLLGKGPTKQEKSARALIDGTYIKWVYPVLNKRGTSLDRVVIEADGERVKLQTIEDVNEVAESVFRVKAPLVKAYNFARALVKGMGAKALTRDFGNDHPALGLLARIVAQEFSERADLRSVRLLPGLVQVGHLTVPTEEPIVLTIRFYRGDRLVETRKVQRTFKHDTLSVLEIVNSQ